MFLLVQCFPVFLTDQQDYQKVSSKKLCTIKKLLRAITLYEQSHCTWIKLTPFTTPVRTVAQWCRHRSPFFRIPSSLYAALLHFLLAFPSFTLPNCLKILMYSEKHSPALNPLVSRPAKAIFVSFG